MSPYTYLDMDKVNQNIAWMHKKLNGNGIEHWPHVKTHKSILLAKKQLDAGAKGLTCSKPKEALVFAEAGLGPLLIAYPIVSDYNKKLLKEVASKVETKTVVDHIDVVKHIDEVGDSIGKTIEVLIDIDGGTHRTGVQTIEEAIYLAKQVNKLKRVKVAGLFTYFGNIYSLGNVDEVKADARAEAELLIQAKEAFDREGLDTSITSGGSTLSSFHAEELKGISQSRAGNYIFGDVNSIHHGVHTAEQCALRIRASIISMPLPGKATIDAGSKTLTSDLSVRNKAYGYIIGKPDIQVTKLNEEHGYIEYDPSQYTFAIGDTLEIIPNHSCIITNLHDTIPYYEGGQYAGEVTIDARGSS